MILAIRLRPKTMILEVGGSDSAQRLLLDQFNEPQSCGERDYPSKWCSNDPTVATVDNMGFIRGIALGTAVVSCKVRIAGPCDDIEDCLRVFVGYDPIGA